MLIKQKTNRIALPNTEIQTVKGTTKIELYNPNTRIKKVFRDENTFQSAKVAAYMRSLGRSGQRLVNPVNPGANDYDYGYSWKNILGGLFLFRDQITEGTQYMPSGNKMVGNGAYMITNAGNPSELGSFNELESSASISGITQVYDFNTAQANGDINCVCLTSQVGGHVGYGNASGNRFSTLRSFYDGASVVGVGNGQAIRNNYRYSFAYVSPTLTVTKTYIPVTVGSIKAGLSESATFDMVSDYSLPANANLASFSQDGQYVYFVGNTQSTPASGTMYYYKYDLDNGTLTRQSMTNSSTTTLYPHSGMTVAHGLAFITRLDNIIDVFDLSTSVLMKENVGGLGYPYTSGLILLYNGGYPYFYDTTNDTIYPTNGAFNTSYNTGYQYWYEPTMDVIYNRQYNDGIPVASNPLYLATINNLDNTVTKTAAQTMKVTYTLTEV